MNSAPSQPNNSFNSQPAGGTQNNPFTQDLKGEFTSNFGTNTNAVSQIFKEGNFGGSNRSRNFIIAGVVVVLVFVAWWMWNEPSTETPDETDTAEVATDEEAAKKEEAATPAAEVAPPVDAAAQKAAEAATAAANQPAVESGSLQLASPSNGAALEYDETQGSASFSWSGGAGTIVFSRHKSMQPEVMRVKVSGGTYSFHRPWPGQWYWKVENEGGASEVRSFTVNAPVRRNIALTAPQTGGALAGTGGVVSWTGDKGVAYYRVELNQGEDWTNPQFKFSSSGSQIQLNSVPAGTYNLRLGAFSEVSGRWEYTSPVSVTVQ